jgi:predicted metal-dependent peptidase
MAKQVTPPVPDSDPGKVLPKLSPQEEEVQEERLRDCRIAVVRVHLKWLNDAVMALRLTKSYEVPAMAVDMWWRCYWNPAKMAAWSDAEICGVIIHEAMHLIRRHSRRSLPCHELWNVVADMEINDDIINDNNKGAVLPGNCCLPKSYKMEDGLTAEDYYDALMKNKVVVKAPQEYGGGSGSDGQKKPWEKGTEGKEGNDAVGDEEGKVIIQRVAKAIQNSNEPGSISAGMKRWADSELESKIDWRTQLRNVVSRSLNFIRGQMWTSFKYPSRRQGEFIFPGRVQANPKVLVITDTSGSMYDELLGQCLAEIKGLLRVITNVEWVSGDTHTCAKGKATKISDVKLEGGGGTDMGRIIEQNSKGYDLIIVLTDGYTPWCNPIRPKVVACIVQGKEGEFNYPMPPEWISTVMVHKN